MVTRATRAEFETFPGWEIISAGLTAIAAGHQSPEACAVWIAFPRLRRVGLVDDALIDRRLAEPERALYRLLSDEGPGAYGRYNAFLRRLVSFEHALDHWMVRQPAGAIGR